MSALNGLLNDVEELRALVVRTRGILQTLDVVEKHFDKSDGWPGHVAPISGWSIKDFREQIEKCERILAMDLRR